MGTLSVGERHMIQEDLNAIRNPSEKLSALDPDVITQKLEAMLAWLAVHKNDAYQEAERISRDYVENRAFLASFLISSYSSSQDSTSRIGSNIHDDAIKAAYCLNEYLECKRQLFGSQCLCQDHITLDDLEVDDMECLETGYWQEIGKDVAGRTIVAIFPILLSTRSPRSFLKALFYFFMSIFPEKRVDDDRIVVLVYYNTTTSEPDMDMDLIQRATHVFRSLPIKVCAHHVVLHPRIHTSLAVSVPFITTTTSIDPGLEAVSAAAADHRCQQCRYVFHSGQTRDEAELTLRRYGISLDIPTNRDGSVVNLEGHRRWIDQRRTPEQLTGLPLSTSDVGNTLPQAVETYSATSSTASGDPSRVGVEPYAIDGESSTMKKSSVRCVSDRSSDSRDDDKKNSHLDDVDTRKRAAATSPSQSQQATATHDSKKQRQTLSSDMLKESSIILPRDSDVLFGRGSGIQNHPGMQIMRFHCLYAT
jgi:hypothetical protein